MTKLGGQFPPTSSADNKILQKNSQSLYKLDSSQIYATQTAPTSHSMIASQPKS